MSFTVAIVVPPVPAKKADALAALDALNEQRSEGPRSPEFQVLHDRLTARFPDYFTLPEDQRDGCVWTDAPLIGNFEHRVAVLGIRPARVYEVLPFLIETATSLGFVVFDDQHGKIHRPRKPEGKPPVKKPAAKRSKGNKGD